MNISKLEEISHALYLEMERLGFSKGTDKTKWREPVMADILGHTAHKKISAGAGKLEYGSDAKDTEAGIYAEYKAKSIVDGDLGQLLGKVKYKKTGKKYVPFTVKGIYNGAYTSESIDKYAKIDHYFGVFYKELCVLIIKVNTEYVIKTLRSGLVKMNKKKNGTKNLNKVSVNLGDTHLYEVAYRNEIWWSENK